MRRTPLFALALLALTVPALANDSEAAIGVGGLALTQNAAISMDSEDLFISADEVRVKYRFTNRSAKDLTLTVSFPVPSIPGNDAELYGYTGIPDLERLKFRTTVDGKPVQLGSVRRAEIDGNDVTPRLRELGWPIDWFGGTDEPPAFIAKLSAGQRAAYIVEGLLRRDTTDDSTLWPAWSVVSHITRRQLFPAGKTVEVTHRYEPLIGGSVAGALEPSLRRDPGFAEHKARYCIDQSFLTAFDRGYAAAKRRNPDIMTYSETWISYILKSGANWRGPIGRFRLVVDKGRPERLVSFCMDGVKKISPTQFEVVKRNFEPTRDLDVLIVNWPGDEG
jgi:Domain of unknown function (DUF4424)